MPSLFPMFLKLEGKVAVVVGGGEVAEDKVQGLLLSGASVRLVSPRVTQQLSEWIEGAKIVWRQRVYKAGDLEGAAVVIAATSDKGANHRIYGDAQHEGILCNVVDDPPHCDFYYPAVVRRGDLQIAISTNGQSPALAKILRRRLEQQFATAYAPMLEQLGDKRRLILQSRPSGEKRKALLHRLAKQALTQVGGNSV
jgi:precorrin-2 dehydrogenase / sirohydrochlorin ferrochelatase